VKAEWFRTNHAPPVSILPGARRCGRMTTKTESRNYLREFGRRLIANGYNPIPIRPGDKRPGIDNWTSIQSTFADVDDWAGNGFASASVGITTGKVRGVDIDVRNAEITESLVRWLERRFPGVVLLRRTGCAPKTMILFQSEPRAKRQSPRFVDPNGVEHLVEFYGQGQQIVAFGLHPDTGKEYRWHGQTPADVPLSKLPVLTIDAETELVKFFEGVVAMERDDWKLKSKGSAGLTVVKTDADPDVKFENFVHPLRDIDLDSARATLAKVDNTGPGVGYDEWFQIGAALWHQFAGADEAFELWMEFSERSDKHDQELMARKWRSFKPDYSRAPVTFASVIKLAKQHAEDSQRDTVDKWFREIDSAKDLWTLKDIVGPAIAREDDIEPTIREMLAQRIKSKWKSVTGTPMSVADARKLVRGKSTPTSFEDAPDWLAGWVYVTQGNFFFNVDTKRELDPQAFRATYDRELIASAADNGTDDDGPDLRVDASRLAVTIWDAATVDHVGYNPKAGPIFDMLSKRYANLYDPDSIPDSKDPAGWTAGERRAVAVIERHFEIMFPREDERRIVLDFLAYCVQNPGSKIKWALFVPSVEGAGKGAILTLLAAAMGPRNVQSLSPQALTKEYNGWAIGRAFTVLNEIRLKGHNRHDIINAIKPMISDDEISIRQMQKDWYQAPNFTNYMAFSNFFDGIPESEGGRRWCMIAAAFQTASQIEGFEKANPTYFQTLFDTVENQDYWPTFRGWFLSREIDPEFNPRGRAPATRGTLLMKELSKSDSELALEDLVSDGAEGVGKTALSSAHVTRILKAKGVDIATTTVNSWLLKAGFQQFKVVKWRGLSCRAWVKSDPDDWTVESVRAALDRSALEGAKNEFLD